MKLHRYIALTVLCALLLGLTGCGIGRKSSVSVDENGIATWPAVDGAQAYECNVVTGDHVSVRTVEQKGTTFEIPEGYCLHVRAVLADGEYGPWVTSDFFGEPVLYDDIVASEEAIVDSGVDPNAQITVDENGIATWALVEGATAYECNVADAGSTLVHTEILEETTYQVPEGYCIHVRAVLAEGQYGHWMISDYFGEPVQHDFGIAAEEESAEQSAVITVDESGIATWTAVEGAQGYECNVVDADYTNVCSVYLEETTYQIPEGYCLHVRAVLPDDQYGHWMISDYFGEPVRHDLGSTAGEALAIVMTEPDFAILPVDENGVVSWEPVPGALYYEYVYLDAEYQYASNGEAFVTTQTSVQVKEGFCLHVSPRMADDSYGQYWRSEFYGTPILWADAPERKYPDWPSRVDRKYEVEFEDLLEYELISNIRLDTVVTHPDGSVTFEADGPDGSVLRFWGTDIVVAEGSVTVGPAGRLMGLDSIGRICAMMPVFSDGGSPENAFSLIGGFTFTDAVSVESVDELLCANRGWSTRDAVVGSETYIREPMSWMAFQPNFFGIRANYPFNPDAFTVTALRVFYDTSCYATPLQGIYLSEDNYYTYMPGEKYDPTRERFSAEDQIYDFWLQLIPEQRDWIGVGGSFETAQSRDAFSVIDVWEKFYTVGDLKSADGTVLDKASGILDVGSTIEVTVGNYTFDVALPMIERYTGARTLHELTPYGNIFSQGEVMPLVVPIWWQDEPETATDEALAVLYARLGRVADLNGVVTDYSDGLDRAFSLSEYYDLVSGGEYSITSFVTEWFAAPFDFAEMRHRPGNDMEFTEALSAWVYETYPDMDWSMFDRDANGVIDAVLAVNFGTQEDFMIFASLSYAAAFNNGYTGENAGTPDAPVIKNLVSLNSFFLRDSTLVHEYGHLFGLIDYYDVTYSGIDAVGQFDMQSSSLGDWNAYSKYAVGWIEPEIVTGLASGESVEITIGSQATTGDAIVIPAAGAEFDGPFGEYILVDLFTGEGANLYDAEDWRLQDAVGVRIYHVNAVMEKRVLMGTDGVEYPIGTVHQTNSYSENGVYHIELIQAGRDNTFTDIDNLHNSLQKKDFFRQGDTFTLQRYAEFFVDGRMDDGSEFGYTVEIVSITKNEAGEPVATIRITRD